MTRSEGVAAFGRVIERWQGLGAILAVIGATVFVANGYGWQTPQSQFDAIEASRRAATHRRDTIDYALTKRVDTLAIQEQFVMGAILEICLNRRNANDAYLRVPCYRLTAKLQPGVTP